MGVATNQLSSLLKLLKPFSETIELKGSGVAEFIYLTGNGKSIEISIDDGSFWIEYWEDCTDEDAQSICENTFNAIEDVQKSVKAWLR